MTLEELALHKNTTKETLVELIDLQIAQTETLREVCDNISAALEWQTTPPPRDRQITKGTDYEDFVKARNWLNFVIEAMEEDERGKKK